MIDAFELRPDESGETAVLTDKRCGFTQALPGHPSLAAPTDDGPRHEVRVVIGDAPIAMRYRLDTLPAGMQPGALAVSMATAYARNRAAGANAQAMAGDGTRCASWNVLAAASAVYPLAHAGPDGDYESLTVLVKPLGESLGVMFISTRFPSTTLSPIRWALFQSAASAGIRWNGGSSVPRLWPESPYLRPGIRGELWPAKQALAESLRGRMVVTPAEAEALRQRLTRLVGGGEAPATPLDAGQLEVFRTYLSDLVADGTTARSISDVLSDVRISQDLRGACLVLLAALA